MIRKKWFNKTLILTGVSILAGLFAAWAAREYIQDKIHQLEKEAQVKTVKRVVAAYDLPEGTRIEAVHVAVRDIPEAWVVSGSLEPEAFVQMEGQVVTTALKRGDPVLWANMARAGNAPFSAKINPGRRAITIPVDAINSVSGMLVPGDLIDLYVSFEYRKRQITAPLLQGVLVMATGRQSRSGLPENVENAREQSYSTVTLDTAPEEAAKLVAARQSGTITALLRNPEDDKATQKGVRGDLASILGIATPPPLIVRKPAVIYGDDAARKLPKLAVAPSTESVKRDERGVFDLPVQEDIVSAWINSLPEAVNTSEGSTSGSGTGQQTLY